MRQTKYVVLAVRGLGDQLMGGQHQAPAPTLVHTLWDDAAARVPDRTALRDGNGAWSYAELARQGLRCAGWLTERGVCAGDRVLVRIDGRRQFAALLYGTSRIGVALVPVSIQLRPFQLAKVLTDANPALVVAADHEVDSLGSLTDRPTVGVDTAWPEIASADTDVRTPLPIDRDPALLLYTSGTTAAPKAVVCPHAQVVFAARAIAGCLGYRTDDVVFSRLPLSFDYGLYQLLLSAIAGAELVLPGESVTAGLLARLRSCAATVVPVVPPLAAMLAALAARDRQPSQVRMFTNTGSRLPAATIAGLRAQFPGAQVVLMFGTTECKRISIMHPDGDLDRPGAVGRPLPGTEVLVVDDAGRPLAAGQVGEIVVRGPHVMSGYWRAPEVTAMRFPRSPDTGEVMLHTGDYGWLDTDGYLHFDGRRDDIFKREGIRVSTLEIEAAALDIPGVVQAAACPPAADGEPTLYVVGNRSPEEVIRELCTRLEPAKVPARCHRLAAIPTTPNGKTDRSMLATATKGQPA